MCIAIYKPENTYVKKHTLQTCFNNHSDGAGFMVFDHKQEQLIVEKGFFSFRKFWRAYKKYKYHRAVIHFRYATHGETDEKNCHPFMVNENLGFVHNGVLQVRTEQKEYSDTWHFNELILKPIVNDFPNAWMHKTMKQLIESFLSDKNKLVFMDRKGNVTIYNEALGFWDADCWFSNETYKTQVVRKRYAQGATGTLGKGTCAADCTGSTWVGNKSGSVYSGGTYSHSTAKTGSNAANRSTDEILLESLMAEAEQEEIGEIAGNRSNVTPDGGGTLLNLGKDSLESIATELTQKAEKEGLEAVASVIGDKVLLDSNGDGNIYADQTLVGAE
jgi:hypothetical protein